MDAKISVFVGIPKFIIKKLYGIPKLYLRKLFKIPKSYLIFVLFITISTLNNTFQCARGVRNIV